MVASLSPAIPQLSDAELLIAHVAGDRDAFAELFVRHRGRLRRLAARRTGTPEDADDALQEAMIKALRAAASFRHHCAVGSWLHRIVVSTCADQYHRTSTRCAVPLDDTMQAVGDRTPQVDTAAVVRGALLTLPVDQRAAVIVVDMHGYSVADAARLLGIPEGTVKSRRARARARLARTLGPLRECGPRAAGH